MLPVSSHDKVKKKIHEGSDDFNEPIINVFNARIHHSFWATHIYLGLAH